MGTREERRQHFLHDQQIKKRLRLATTRLHEAEHERIWAIVAAYDAGLSIRQIATATGLSRSRIHQLLQDDEAREIPAWLTHLRARNHASEGEADTEPSSSQTAVQARVAKEVEVLRWCIDWLAQLERGEMVVVNLRPDTEDATEFVRFDQARVLRVLARIAADLDALARHDLTTEMASPAESMDPRMPHRRRLAEPEESPRGRTAKEQREALRKACGLPPYDGDYTEYFRHIRGTQT
jgi:transcriptional regulator with XRE-family HTH domain